MHKDRQEGAGKQVRGNIKKAVGTVTGDEDLHAQGEVDEAEGKVQDTVGKLKDKARDALKH